jgi:hypothetical protein
MTTMLPSPFCSAGVPHDAPPAEALPAAVSGTEHPAAGSVEIPVSPGVVDPSLPSGESEPSVMLAYAPGESKQRLLEAIEDDYRFQLDEEKFMFDIGFVPDNFEKYMTLLDQLVDDDPPLFLQRTG